MIGLPDPRPEIIKKIVGNVHYLHFGCILFLISLVTAVLVSLITEPIDEKYVWNLVNSYVRIIISKIPFFAVISSDILDPS